MNVIKRYAALFAMVLAGAPALHGQQPRAAGQPAATAPAPAAVNDQLLQALYVSEFQRQVGVNDEQIVGRLRTILTQWLQQRRNAAQRRNEATASLRQLLAANPSDEEIARKIVEVDTADNQMRNSERRLQSVVDPLLTPAQQAKFRLFQIDIEQRIRELLAEASRTAGGPRRTR
jgi:hypothetical protein